MSGENLPVNVPADTGSPFYGAEDVEPIDDVNLLLASDLALDKEEPLNAESQEAVQTTLSTELLPTTARESAIIPSPVQENEHPVPSRRKRKGKQPLLRPLAPKIRATADSSADRPARFFFAYASTPGSTTDSAGDRMLIIDNWYGNNEHALFACAEGFGVRGDLIADYIMTKLPVALDCVSRDRVKTSKQHHNKPTTDTGSASALGKTLSKARELHRYVSLAGDEAALSKPTGPKKTVPQRLAETLKTAMKRIDDELRAKSAEMHAQDSGASACAVILRGKHLIVSHIGSCRVVVAREVDAMDAEASLMRPTATVKSLSKLPSAKPDEHPEAHSEPVAATRVNRLDAEVAVMDVRKFSETAMTALVNGSLDMVYAPETGDTTASLLLSASRSTLPAQNALSNGSRVASRPSISSMQSTLRTGSQARHLPGGTPSASSSSLRGWSRASTGTKSTLPPIATGPSFTPTPGLATSSKRETVAARRKALLQSHSMPSFPDLPRELEQVLQFPESTYKKPSMSIMLSRASAVEKYRSEHAAKVAGTIAATAPHNTSIDLEDMRYPVDPGSALPNHLRGLPTRSQETLASMSRSASLVDYTLPPAGWDKSKLGKAVSNKFLPMHKAEMVNTQAQALCNSSVRFAGTGTPHAPRASPMSTVSSSAGSREAFPLPSSSRATSRPAAERAYEHHSTQMQAASETAARAIAALERGFMALDEQVTKTAALTRSLKGAIEEGYKDALPQADVYDEEAIQRRLEYESSSTYKLSAGLGHSTVSAGRLAAIALQSGLSQKMANLGRPTSAAKRFAYRAFDETPVDVVEYPGLEDNSPSPSSSQSLRRTFSLEGTTKAVMSDGGGFADARYFAGDGTPAPTVLPVAVSIDHRPDRPDEGARLVAAGARIQLPALPSGKRGNLPRICAPMSDGPALVVSRCIGYHSADKLGVAHEPETFVHPISASDKFVIIASDGLWSVMTSEEAAYVVNRVIQGTLLGGTGTLTGTEDRVKATCDVPVPTLTSRRSRRTSPNHDSRHGIYRARSAHSLIDAEMSGLDDLIQGAARINPTQTSVGRTVMPAIVYPAPIGHESRPGVECRVKVSPGRYPVCGFGGGSSVPMDLIDSLIDPIIREKRVHKQRTLALSAAEALIAAARARWQHWAREHAPSDAHHLMDDVSVLVIIFEI